jgi:hypothetical protein
MNRHLKGIILLCTVIMLATACKSTRPLIRAPLKEQGPDYLYSRLKDSELHFNWLSLKFDAKVR